eukprot:3417647-Pyramimonas_sp.AAC.1
MGPSRMRSGGLRGYNVCVPFLPPCSSVPVGTPKRGRGGRRGGGETGEGGGERAMPLGSGRA